MGAKELRNPARCLVLGHVPKFVAEEAQVRLMAAANEDDVAQGQAGHSIRGQSNLVRRFRQQGITWHWHGIHQADPNQLRATHAHLIRDAQEWRTQSGATRHRRRGQLDRPLDCARCNDGKLRLEVDRRYLFGSYRIATAPEESVGLVGVFHR